VRINPPDHIRNRLYPAGGSAGKIGVCAKRRRACVPAAEFREYIIDGHGAK